MAVSVAETITLTDTPMLALITFPQPKPDWNLFRISWLYDAEPFDLVHYEAQETDYDFLTWHVERDAYLDLRSDGAVILTIIIDGVTQPSYSISSTAGTRRNIYIPFVANKGKLYRYLLDSASDFHLYDLSIRAKGWDEPDYRTVRPVFTKPSPQWTDETIAVGRMQRGGI